MRSQELLESFLSVDKGHEVSSSLVSGTFDQALLEEYERVTELNKQLRKALEEAQKKALRYQQRIAPLDTLDYNNLSPKQAFDVVWALKEE